MYVLGYQVPSFKSAKAVRVTTNEQAVNYITNLPEDFAGIVIDMGAESQAMRRMTGPMLVLYHNLLAEVEVKKFHDLAAGRTALFRVVERAAQDAPPEMLLASVVEEAQTDDAPAEDPAPATDQTEAETQQADTPETDASAETLEEANMAAKTKPAKAKKPAKAPKEKKVKAAKAPKTPKEKKVSNGLPRAGSKKAELLRLLQRQNGATMAEMLEATGWKACLGTAKAVAEAAKQKFSHERGTGDKPSRWYAK